MLEVFCRGGHACVQKQSGVLAGTETIEAARRSSGIAHSSRSLPQKFRSRNVLNCEFKFKHLGQLKANPCLNELQDMTRQSLESPAALPSTFQRKQCTGQEKLQHPHFVA